MTLFSIHKIFIMALFVGVFGLVGAPQKSHAQIADLKDQIKDAENQINKLKDLKEKTPVQNNDPIVIELFTAPDCSACIYADRLLFDAMKNENVIGLSCYIDGRKESIKDDGAIDQCIFRQWAYSKGARSNYGQLATPQFVFNGDESLSSANMSRFDEVMNGRSRGYDTRVNSVFMEWKDENTIRINLPDSNKRDSKKAPASVYLIQYKNMMVEKVEDGPNKGRVLRYSNVIKKIDHIGKWYQKERIMDVDVEVPLGGKEAGGYVVLVQNMLGERVLAAGKLSDYPIRQ